MNIIKTFFSFIFLASYFTYAQNIELVADINSILLKDNENTIPVDCITFNGKLLIVMSVGGYGTELWEYSGIDDPILVSDINSTSTSEGSDINSLTIYEGKLYFSATDGISGQELWVYDGVNIPSMIYDINAGIASSSPSDLYVFQDKLFFTADNGINDAELWSFDGVNNPVMIADIHTAGASNPNYKVEFNNKLYFSADDGVNGIELWSYDGVNSPSLEKDIFSGSESSSPMYLTVYNDKLYFSGRHFSFIRNRIVPDLYRYDEESNLELFYQQSDAEVPSSPNELTVYNNKLYLTVLEFSQNRVNEKLISIDALDNIRHEYINQYGRGGVARVLRVYNNKLYFQARPTDDDYALFEINEDDPPVEILDRSSMEGISTTNNLNFRNYIFFNEQLYLTAEQNNREWEIWEYDFTNNANVAWDDFQFRSTDSSRIYDVIVYNEKLYFTANDGIYGSELWSYDDINGSAPTLIFDINLGQEGSRPEYKTIFNNKLYFSADNGIDGKQLYVYDGISTPALAYDLSVTNGLSLSRSTPEILNNKLYFIMLTNTYENQLWSFNGVDLPIRETLITNETQDEINYLFSYKNKFHYFIYDADNKVNNLWSFDGSSVPNFVFSSDIGGSMKIVNDKLYIINSGTYYYYYNDDNNSDNNGLYRDFSELAFSDLLGEYNGKLYVSGDESLGSSDIGREVYEYDIASSSTGSSSLVRYFDINPGSLSSHIRESIVYDNKLYFSAIDGIHGRELWSYDGINLPELIQDINSDNSDNGIFGYINGFGNLIVYNDKLFFTATTYNEGGELRSYKTENILNTDDFVIGKENIVLVPNPTQKSFVINGLKDTVEIAIYDIFGKFIMRKKNVAIDQEVNTSFFKPGMYVIKINYVNDSRSINKKMIIK